MTREDYVLWCDYHKGKLNNRELTNDQMESIRSSEMAMHLLVPTEAVLRMAKENGGLENLIVTPETTMMYSECFGVNSEVFLFKVQYLIDEEQKPNFVYEKKDNILKNILGYFKKKK